MRLWKSGMGIFVPYSCGDLGLTPNARGEPRQQPERGTSGGCWRRLQCFVRRGPGCEPLAPVPRWPIPGWCSGDLTVWGPVVALGCRGCLSLGYRESEVFDSDPNFFLKGCTLAVSGLDWTKCLKMSHVCRRENARLAPCHCNSLDETVADAQVHKSMVF